MSRKTSYYAMKGGLNTETPALSLNPGELIDVLNYEPNTGGGYRRIDGIERVDCLNLPSDATYYAIEFTGGTTEPVGEVLIFGESSGAVGKVLGYVVDSGDWSTNDATGCMAYYVIEGVFANGEVLVLHESEAFTTGFSIGFR